LICFYLIENGPVVAGWGADLSSVRNLAGDRKYQSLPNVRVAKTEEFYTVCNLLSAHRKPGTQRVFRDSAELRALIQRLHDFSWSTGGNYPDFKEFSRWG
jgi:hypothetical protein